MHELLQRAQAWHKRKRHTVQKRAQTSGMIDLCQNIL
jgi:hypothetical protein